PAPAQLAPVPTLARSVSPARAGPAPAAKGARQHSQPPSRDRMSWALHRVDDRLIHGQVVVAWGGHLHPRRIWVVDDATAANDWERKLLATAAPEVEVRVLTVAEAAAEYGQEASAEGASILLVRSLAAAAELLEAGAAI